MAHDVQKRDYLEISYMNIRTPLAYQEPRISLVFTSITTAKTRIAGTKNPHLGDTFNRLCRDIIICHNRSKGKSSDRISEEPS